MKHTTFLAATAAATLIGTGAMAASVSIDQIDGTWQNPAPAAISTVISSSGGTESIRWGDDIGNGQSGYDFTPTSPLPFTLAEDTPTVLGTFTHLNRPIGSGTSIDSVELDFSFGGSVLEDAEGNMFPAGFLMEDFGAVFDFDHNETPNQAANCPTDPVACSDIVTVAAQGGANETIRVQNTLFTFTLLGFSPDGVNFSNMFVTTEGLDNSQDLYFEYTVSVVPLPAAGWLLLAGLGGLGVVGRRKKSA